MENLVVSSSKKFEAEKFTTQMKVITQNMVKKVLSSTAKSEIVNCECINGTLSLSGKIKFEILYLNGENKVEFASNETDFIEKQKLAIELSNVYAIDLALVEDINFSSNEIICSVSHNTEIYGIYNYSLPNFDNAEGDIVADKTSLKASKLITSASDEFSVSEESETNLRGIQILKTNAEAIIDETSSSVDKIVLDGRILAEIIYLEGENVSSFQKQFDFRQEIAAENVIPNMKASAFASVKNANVSFDDAGEKCMLSYNFDLTAKCYALEENTYEIAKDMFMLSNEIAVVYDYVESKNGQEIAMQTESFMTQTDITEIIDFEDIIGVFEPAVRVIKIENQGDKAEIMAKFNAYALYKDSQGISRLDIEKELVFELNCNDGKFVDSVRLDCQIVSFKVKAGKEIEASFKVNYYASLMSMSVSPFVKSYDILGEKEVGDEGIKVYVVRENQSIFDIAKALNVRPALIEDQNQIDGGFESGQKVYVYSPINLA